MKEKWVVDTIFCLPSKPLAHLYYALGVRHVPITIIGRFPGYINQSNDKTGYWFSLVFVVLGGCVLSLLPEDELLDHPVVDPSVSFSTNCGPMDDPDMDRMRYNFPPLELDGDMSTCSKVGHFLMADHHRHSVHMDMDSLCDKPLVKTVNMSYSDPEAICQSGVNSRQKVTPQCDERPVSILKRQKTWHKCDSNGVNPPPPPPPPGYGHVVPPSPDVMVVDLITSTV